MALILPAHGTCEKTERGFCSSSRYGEKPLSVFQNSFSFARNRLRKKTGQNACESGFCLGRVVFRTPPEVVSGFRGGGGGGGPLACGADTCPRGGFIIQPFRTPPPLVKLRMARGGPEIFISVDLIWFGMYAWSWGG
jgi:hypothetical protein